MVSERVMVVDGRTVPFIWFHYQVDDLPLTPYELAIYFHIVRRGSKSGVCNESLDHIADQKGVSVGAVKKAIRGLISYGLVRRESKPGRSSNYVIQDIAEWNVSELRAAGWGGHETTQVAQQPRSSENPGHQTTHTQVTTDPPLGHERSRGGSVVTHEVDQLSNSIQVDQKEDPEPIFSFSGEQAGERLEVDQLPLESQPALPVKVQDSGKDKSSAGPVEKIIQADFELMQPGEQQNFRLRGDAIALDPWILDTPSNQSKVLAGRVTRCDFNADFCVYLTQQLAQSPYWQERLDEPPANSGLRQIKDFYAIPAGPQRDAEREKMQGLWDKWQESIAQRDRNEALRASAAAVPIPADEGDRVPFSQLSEEQQAQIRNTVAKVKAFTSGKFKPIQTVVPVHASAPIPPQAVVSHLEQIQSLPPGPVRDREIAAYRQDGGGEATASAPQRGMVSLQTLMPSDSFAQEGF